jgi:hypothetical protein
MDDGLGEEGGDAERRDVFCGKFEGEGCEMRESMEKLYVAA